jgi:hypothetical protein
MARSYRSMLRRPFVLAFVGVPAWAVDALETASDCEAEAVADVYSVSEAEESASVFWE